MDSINQQLDDLENAKSYSEEDGESDKDIRESNKRGRETCRKC